jgi:hypothetical protein
MKCALTQVEKREIGDDPNWGATLHGVVFNILVGSDGQSYQKHHVVLNQRSG